MSNRIEQVKIGPPISLGEPVTVLIGQASAFIQHDDGRAELYTVSNGAPGIFYVVELPSGKVLYEYEVVGSHAVWAMTVKGQDVYFCATDDEILYRFSGEKREVEQLGLFPSGHFVWDLCVSDDGKVYGGTYPKAEIFEYDPATHQYKDLGRMDDEQHYVRSVIAVDQYLFAGIGSQCHLMQYDRTTQTKKELMVEGYSGKSGFIYRMYKGSLPNTLFIFTHNHTCVVYDYVQEKVLDKFSASCYISKPSPDNGEHYYVDGVKLYSYNSETQEKTEHAVFPILNDEKLIKNMTWMVDEHNNNMLAIVYTTMEVLFYTPALNRLTLHPVEVPARTVALQSMEWDGAEHLYMGGYHRGLSIFNTTTEQVEKCYTNFPQIEGMNFIKGKVYFGTYTKANIFDFDPSQGIANTDPSFLFQIEHHQDRPFAITEADDKIFFGTIADYGLLTGAIAMYDTVTGEYETYPNIVPEQSIIGLAYKDGLIYGGTTNWGGIGIEPTETEAKLFVWDIKQKKVIHSFTPEVPGIDIPPRMIGDLRFGPDGLLWGAVDGSIFALNTDTLTVEKGKMIYPSEYKYNHIRPYFLRWSEDGLLFAALAKKLIVIDPDTLEHKVLEEGPLPLMTLGPNGDIYYNEYATLIKRERLS